MSKQFNADDVGLFIDESAGSADRLNRRIIAFAEGLGFEADGYTEDDLGEVADEAVEWLNENAVEDDDVYFTIDDNSLFLWESEDDDGDDGDDGEDW